MDYARQRQLIGANILLSTAFRFLIIILASVVLVKIVSLLLARSSELHALELLSAADAYLAKDGSSSGGGN